MPTFGNIVVKKADGTTDVTFVGLVRAAGDSSPARYEQQAGFPVPANRPAVAISCRSVASPTGPSRRVTLDGVYPIIDATGVEIGRITLQNCRVTVPTAVSSVAAKEAVYQLLKVAASAAVKDSAVEGYAPA